MRTLQTFADDRSGSAAAEFALVLPLVLILILVTFEGGYYLYSEHKVAKGVRDGARYAARLAFTNYDCPPGSINNSDAETRIKQVTRTGFPDGDNPALTGTDNPVVGGWVVGDVTVTVSCATNQGGLYTAVSGNAPKVRVNANVGYPSLFQLAVPFRLRAVAESAVMGI